ncbi:MAG: anthranilate synthase component 1 [Myxococcota bacterium]
MHLPDRQTFIEQAKPGYVVPVYREVVTDLLTPLAAFRRLDRDPEQAAYLLESVEGGEKWGRYSFIGIAPRRLMRSRGHTLEVVERGEIIRTEVDDPLAEICAAASSAVPAQCDELPRFWGGLVGYLGYDMVRFIEKLPETADRDLPIWDSYLVEAGIVVALDSLRQRAQVICPVRISEATDVNAAWAQAQSAIDAAVARLRRPVPLPDPAIELDPLPEDPPANLDGPAFEAAVEKAREYISAGDIIQVVLSRRFEIPTGSTRPFDIYRALRLTNPSPYMFFLRFPEYAVVGASPEILVRREDDVVEVRPIAGTRRRGKNPVEDAEIADELRADPKEVAEHVMLLDLGRNDIGRIADVGSVTIEEQMIIERYSHVMHLVSSVCGRVGPDVTAEAIIRATFPAGTLSGAPKVRAMEIIEELEPHGRGIYGGAAGYLSYNGNLDLAIAIRSVLALPDRLLVQAGAGIVWDSVPSRELEETREKARGVLRAIRLAREAFGP